MKEFHSLAKTMLDEAKKNSSSVVMNKISVDVLHTCAANRISSADVTIDSDDAIITIARTSITRKIENIAMIIAEQAQEFGYLVSTPSSVDGQVILKLRPFNCNDYELMTGYEVFSLFESTSLSDFGALAIRFLPTTPKGIAVCVDGVFNSGAVFDDFVEGLEHCDIAVTDTAYSFHNDNTQDHVTILL